jgi:hypothetical protein
VLRARFVARLFLSPLVAHDALITALGWTRFGFRHALLAAMFAALILRTFKIVFLRHRDQILFSRSMTINAIPRNAIPRRRVPSVEDKKTRLANRARRDQLGEVSGVETSNR